MNNPNKIPLFTFLLLLFFISCKHSTKQQNRPPAPSPFNEKSASFSSIQNKAGSSKMHNINPYIKVELDSASNLKVMDSLVNGCQLLQIDGLAHFHIRQAPETVMIYTGMMKLITRNAHFTIDAYKSSPGQLLKVYGGKLIATKAYPSDFPNTDTLTRGDMILINIDIDLMEKETFDTTGVIKK